MKGVWSQFVEVSKKNDQDLLLLYNKMILFEKPYLALKLKNDLCDITEKVYEFTETLLIKDSKCDEFIEKCNKLLSKCKEVKLQENDLMDLLKIWIIVIKEECRRSWITAMEKIISTKLDDIISYYSF